jgi:membrane associated rhomboid family serine protease/Tfp pilus assembly protein PilF
MDSQIPVQPKPSETIRVPARRYRPVATYVLLTINIMIFLLMTLHGGSKNPDVLLEFGASYGPYLRQGEYWRLVMPMFLHIGWLHLALNMYALWLLGSLLEPLYGYGRFSVIYVGAGVGGSFLSMMASPHVAAGASGAIFGIAGAMMVTGFLHHWSVPRRWRRAFGAGIIFVIVSNLVLGWLIPNIDNWAHLGGLFAGSLLAGIIPPPRVPSPPKEYSKDPWQAVVVIPAGLVIWGMLSTAHHYQLTQRVTQLLNDASHLRQTNQDGLALRRLKQAEQIAPYDEGAHESMGNYYFDHQQYSDAIREYEEALRLDPNSPMVMVRLAVADLRTGRPAKAQKLLAEADQKVPRDANAQMILADLCNTLKLYDEAAKHYEEALEIQPKLAVAHNNLAWLFATCDDPKLRNPTAALNHALIAVKLTNGKEPNFLDTLAEALYVNGKFKEAVDVQKKALELSPNNPEFQQHMQRYQKAASGLFLL